MTEQFINIIFPPLSTCLSSMKVKCKLPEMCVCGGGGENRMKMILGYKKNTCNIVDYQTHRQQTYRTTDNRNTNGKQQGKWPPKGAKGLRGCWVKDQDFVEHMHLRSLYNFEFTVASNASSLTPPIPLNGLCSPELVPECELLVLSPVLPVTPC